MNYTKGIFLQRGDQIVAIKDRVKNLFSSGDKNVCHYHINKHRFLYKVQYMADLIL
jgi:hypothetical protein